MRLFQRAIDDAPADDAPDAAAAGGSPRKGQLRAAAARQAAWGDDWGSADVTRLAVVGPVHFAVAAGRADFLALVTAKVRLWPAWKCSL